MVTQPNDPQQAQAWIRGSAPDEIVDFYIPRGNQGLPGPRGPMGPGVTVGSVVVTNGPAAPGTLGPVGPTGAKGDPGGLILGTSLSTNDLNTITADGIYRQSTQTNATLAKNYPIANVIGILYVNSSSTTSYVQQIFYPGYATTSRTFYMRVNSGGTWNPWRAFSSTRVDQTAGRAIYQWDDLNGREQLVYGDTGSRDISSLVDTTKFTISVAKIRRVGWQVELRLSLTPAAGVNGTATILPAALPVGFQNQHSYNGLAVDTSNLPIAYGLAFAGGPLTINGLVAARNFSLMMNFQTYNPWPTALPGTADGAIANT